MPMFSAYVTETRRVTRHTTILIEADTKLAAKSQAYDLVADEDESINWNPPDELDSDRDIDVHVEEDK